jgi:hypothetical protein
VKAKTSLIATGAAAVMLAMLAACEDSNSGGAGTSGGGTSGAGTSGGGAGTNGGGGATPRSNGSAR